ncbi:GNAT family protein [Bacillus sp. P14.5]|uniref:GNAT family N-acetyltransferase n=1 Tax=Bacillus sp. P14.5 TaxID=1983400 RepID=UPI000DEA7D38|nr:GNAT family protein [Bacillus sp. P14.5]
MKVGRKFPDLYTDRLYLRNVRLEDTEFIFKLYSDEDVCEYLYDEEVYTNREQVKEFIQWNSNPEEQGNNRWCILKRSSQEVIGTCGFDSWDRENNIVEIGYNLWKDFWGKGYMKEALIAAINNGFANMDLNRINAFVALDNLRSIHLLESLGFIREGIYREKHLYRGKYYDHFTYSLLKRDWKRNERGS